MSGPSGLESGYRSVVVTNADRADSTDVFPLSAYTLQSQIFFTDDCPEKGALRRARGTSEPGFLQS